MFFGRFGHYCCLLQQDKNANVQRLSQTTLKLREIINKESFDTLLHTIKQRSQWEAQRRRESHKKKLCNILPRPHARETNLKEKWVVNISDRPQSTSEKSALSLNFNFAITPKSLPVPQIVSSIESGIDQLPNAEKDLIRASVTSAINNWRPPPRSSITNEEKKALRDLAKDTSVTILPAYRGRAVVVMNTNDYVDKINNLLNDEKTYHKITDKRRNPTSSTEKSLNKLLLQIKHQPASHDSSKKQLEPKLYYKLHSTDSTPASFYGLPKIHKDNATISNKFFPPSHLNSINPHIKFTIEVESEDSIAFLDTKTTRREDGSITVSVYRKATNTDRYLDLRSHHHPQQKHSVARTLMDRARNIPSTEEEVSRETKRVAEALATNNNPANFIHNLRQPSRQQETNDIDHRGFVIVPYAKGFSERIANVLRGFNIKVAHKPIRTISNILKKPKDRIEKEDTRGIVYKIKCNDCDCVYVGQTSRALKTRMKEHAKAIAALDKNSLLAKHVCTICLTIIK
ncbi:hypothetical protein ACROYT_G030890 [Oculina patagonica]